MNNTTSVIMAGVGGQGTILASKLLGTVAMDEGLDVKVSEVHGMSQRGGSVITYVRYGDTVYSPVTEAGEADYIIAFEELEAVRWLPMLKKGGTIIMSSQHIDPAPVLSGDASYPTDIEQFFIDRNIKCIKVDALEFARDSGFSKAANVVMMGAFAAVSEFSLEAYKKSLETNIPARFLEGNRKAFMLGYDSVR